MDSLPTLILLIHFFLMFCLMFFLGRHVEKRFKDIDDKHAIFKERFASGHSTKNFITRIGGASNALTVIVTKDELCIKGILGFFTFIGNHYDLTKRLPLDTIKEVKQKRKRVELSFHPVNGKSQANIVLRLRKSDAFVEAISK